MINFTKRYNNIQYMIVDAGWACKYGFQESAILGWVVNWIKKNALNNKHFYDGRTWIYNSRSSWIDLFPFWTENEIRGILNRLIEKNVLLTGNYNKTKMDRTTWYALVNEPNFNVMSNGEGAQRDLSLPKGGLLEFGEDQNASVNLTNGESSINQSICENNLTIPIKNTNKEKHIKENTVFDDFRKLYPGTKRGFKTEYENFRKKHKDWKEVEVILKEVLEKQIRHRKVMFEAKQFVPAWKNLQTWINQRCWEEELPNSGESCSVDCEEPTKTPWDTFVNGHSEPAMKAYQYILDLWESVSGDEWKDVDYVPDAKWPSFDRVMKTAYLGIQTNKSAGVDKKTCVEKMKDYFKMEKRILDESQY